MTAALTQLMSSMLTLCVPQHALAFRPSALGAVPVCRRAPVALMTGTELPPWLQEQLRASGIEDLNPLQDATNDATMRGLDVIIHAQTGSGKTLCFALPMLSQMVPDVPLQGLVLVPTLELAAQTARVFNSLRADSAAALSRETSEIPQAPILVGPPAMLLKLIAGGGISDKGGASLTSTSRQLLSALRVVVLDEADALLMPLGRYATLKDKMRREDHPKEAATLLEMLCTHRGHELQIMAASATVGRPLRRSLAAMCDRSLEIIRAPAGVTSHADPVNVDGDGDAPPLVRGAAPRAVGLTEGVSVEVVTADADNVIAALHDVLTSEAASSPLLFIPPGRSLGAEIRLLRQCALDAVALDSEVLLRAADTSVPLAAPAAASASSDSETSAPGTPPEPAAADGGPCILVAAPSGARGLDLHGLDLVVIMGVPPTADAFVHLAGRTARQGSRGRVVVLTTPEEAQGRMPTIASQLGMDLAATHRRHVNDRDEGWASMWTVHEKIVHAEEKAAAAAGVVGSMAGRKVRKGRRTKSRR